MELGLIRPSSSPYASSVVMVKKKDRTFRMCIALRDLNKKNVKNRLPIPRIHDPIDELHGANFFSNIDLSSCYHKIWTREEDIPKTAFKCHYGHFEFGSMPFVLTNSLSTFQSCMNNIFDKQLRNFVLLFFDDILIYNKI